MSRSMLAVLLALSLTAVPAVAAENPPRTSSPGSTQSDMRDDAMRQQCQKYQGAEREKCMKGQFGGQMGQHPALPEGGATRQEVPGTGTTVPR